VWKYSRYIVYVIVCLITTLHLLALVYDRWQPDFGCILVFRANSFVRNLKMAAPIKAQLFGHSFVSRLKDFIRSRNGLYYRLGLQLGTMVQFTGFPGARGRSLIGKMQFVAEQL
jgi:Mn2+/Fe2+ NRAMP family transporter